MFNITHYIIRILIIVHYCIYAVSPIYSSLSAEHNDTVLSASENSAGEVKFGIVMLNLMIAPLMDEQAADTSDKNNIDFLIAKKRIAVREHQQFIPIVETAILPPEDPAPVLHAFSDYDTLHHCRHQAPDGYFKLDSGLSPPVSLS